MRVLSFGALGRGDVRLALALGGALAYFSMVNLVWASLVTFIVGGVFSLALVLFGMARSGTRVAFGPFMLWGRSPGGCGRLHPVLDGTVTAALSS